MNCIKVSLAGFLITGCLWAMGHAQTSEEIILAQVFFETHDNDGNTLLSHEEFVEGFIAQSIADRPTQTRLAMLLYGRKRIENCLGLGFERADQNNNGLLAFEELSKAYAQDAFADLGEMC